MKYLKRFNESNLNLQEVVNDCQDILIDLADDGVKYKVVLDSGLVININDFKNRIALKKYADNFERLFDYLESLGFKLDKTSYYESDYWDLYKRCPNCGSQNLKSSEETHSEYICKNCKFQDDQAEFLTSEHPLTKGDLMWSIKSGDKPTQMHLFFTLAK